MPNKSQEQMEREELESLGLIQSSTPNKKADPEQEEELKRRLKALEAAEVRTVKNRDLPRQELSPEDFKRRMDSDKDEADKVRERRERRRKLDRESRSSMWEREVPPKFLEAKISLLPSDLRRLCDDWLTDEPRNIILCGNTGVGKSWTAYALARELFLERKDIHITEVAVWLDSIKPGVEANDVEFRRSKTCGVLFLEDLGAERHTNSGWADERISLLIDHRWQWNLPTIVTTNVAKEGLFDIMNERAASRLLNDAVVYEFKGEDRRLS